MNHLFRKKNSGYVSQENWCVRVREWEKEGKDWWWICHSAAYCYDCWCWCCCSRRFSRRRHYNSTNKILSQFFFSRLIDANKWQIIVAFKYDIRVRSPFIWWFAYVRLFRVWFRIFFPVREKKINFLYEGQRAQPNLFR